MKYLFPLILALSLGACATPTPYMPTASGDGIATRGGDASGKQTKTDPQGAFSYMGSAINASAASEDLTQGTNAAWNLTIAFPGGRAPDLVEQSYAIEMQSWLAKMMEASTPEDVDVFAAKLDGARKALVEYASSKPPTVGTPSDGPVATTLVIAPIYWQWGTVSPEKITNPEIVKSMADGVKAAMDVAKQ